MHASVRCDICKAEIRTHWELLVRHVHWRPTPRNLRQNLERYEQMLRGVFRRPPEPKREKPMMRPVNHRIKVVVK
jgi:hypothetical protein